MQTQNATQQDLTNSITHGDCIRVMQQMPTNSVDFVLTDPPYLVNFRDRTGRTLQNDTDDNWLKPAMAAAYRVLKHNRLMLCFYGWPRADKFLEAWREAGFRPVDHLVFQKSYTSKARFLKYQHEQAYLLAKGNPPLPRILSRTCNALSIPATSYIQRRKQRCLWCRLFVRFHCVGMWFSIVSAAQPQPARLLC